MREGRKQQAYEKGNGSSIEPWNTKHLVYRHERLLGLIWNRNAIFTSDWRKDGCHFTDPHLIYIYCVYILYICVCVYIMSYIYMYIYHMMVSSLCIVQSWKLRVVGRVHSSRFGKRTSLRFKFAKNKSRSIY